MVSSTWWPWLASRSGYTMCAPQAGGWCSAAGSAVRPSWSRCRRSSGLPFIRAYLLRWGRRVGSRAVAREARFYFGVSAEAPLRDIQDPAEHYPVFRIEYAGDPGIRAEQIAEGVYRLETGRGLTEAEHYSSDPGRPGC